jgi:hypothetical protein
MVLEPGLGRDLVTELSGFVVDGPRVSLGIRPNMILNRFFALIKHATRELLVALWL